MRYQRGSDYTHVNNWFFISCIFVCLSAVGSISVCCIPSRGILVEGLGFWIFDGLVA